MSWIVFAGLSAFFESLKDLISKQSLRLINPYLVAWSLVLFALPLLWPLVWIQGIPTLGDQFMIAVWVGGSINVIAMMLYIKALQWSDLSLTVPLITLTPLFLLLTSPLIVGEYPTASDIVGILLIVMGAYCLNVRGDLTHLWSPFVSLWRDRGSRAMLFVAFLWSFSAAIDKIGVQNSSPTFWVVSLFTFIAVGMFPIVLWKCPQPFTQIVIHGKILAPIGVFQGLAVLVQMQALQLTLVARVIAVKRMSALFSVLWGGLILKESGIRDRLIGTAMMVLGVVCLSIL